MIHIICLPAESKFNLSKCDRVSLNPYDNGRALLVEEITYGKRLIQSLFELPDDSGIAVTVAKYETPHHKDINKLGIKPDFLVPQEPITYAQIGTKADLQPTFGSRANKVGKKVL